METQSARRIAVTRLAAGRFLASNGRGGSVVMSSSSTGGSDLTPVELLLAALGGCTAMDVDAVTSRRAEPLLFEVIVEADKIRDESGNRLTDIVERFRVAFPDTAGGAQATDLVPGLVDKSHDRLCTVGRTVQVGASITTHIEPSAE